MDNKKEPAVTYLLGRGTHHEKEQKPCQDRLSVSYSQNPKRLVMVVSDGCSGSAFAEEAATINNQIIQGLFRKNTITQCWESPYEVMSKHLDLSVSRVTKNSRFTECLTELFFQEFQRRKKKLEKQKQCVIDDRDLFATLVFVVWEWERNRLLVGHIGDGNAVCLGKNGKVLYRSEEENGEASNMTYFTFRADAGEHFHAALLDGTKVERVVLFSDGLQNLFKGFGSIQTGVEKLIGKKPLSMMEERLKKELSQAAYFGFDDWSIICASKTQLCKKKNVEPVFPRGETALSLKTTFDEAYARREAEEGKRRRKMRK